ncbi:DUF2971 domain-containing protein [Streptococcus sanguinis]|uniref:DUF2971 domain-containing protein n=1 Tax=Streptococcus sanguinis TaxID=1305 RepID=UPI00228446B0|nr:DUF2971 domain-containing protein [Streptococcus sanguinis]MCY7021098.1 DUF2971 domain-containing protein [Streptococcus sanguinis]
MVCIAWDNETYYKNSVKNQRNPNYFVFYLDNWNDYGYYLTFTVCYYDQNLNETLLGNYRIYNPSIEEQIDESGIKKISTQILSDMSNETFYNYDDSHNFEGINCNYYSLAQDISFYHHLYTLGTGCYENFLKEFRDLTVIDLPDDIKEKEGVKKALLRNDGITKSEDIIKLERHLKEIDERLNVGNFQKDNSIKIIAKKFIEDNGFEDYEKLFEQIKLLNNWGDDYLTPILEGIVKEIDESEEVNEHQIKSFEKYLDKIRNPKKLLAKIKERSPDKKHIETIEKAVENIKKELRIDLDKFKQFSAEDDLVHYTSLSTLDILVKKNNGEYPKLRLSNARQLNDPTEGAVFLNEVGFDIFKLLQLDYESTDIFLASMSKSSVDNDLSDSLPMWKQYADNATGICLTYDRDYIQNLIKKENNNIEQENNSEVEFYKVCYTNQLKSNDYISKQIETIKKELEYIELNESKSEILSIFDVVRYLFKESNYEYEQEYRFIKECKNNEDIKIEKYGEMKVPKLFSYIDKELKYSKIKLGPKCEDIDYIAPYIKFVDSNIEVTQSQIPYR